MNQPDHSGPAQTPRFSIVVPIRNRSSLFQTTVHSLRQQSEPAWEAVIVDDGSSAGELEQIKALVDMDRRLRLIRNPGRKGACAARNAGLDASAGEYVIFLDSDDALSPTCLEHRLRLMQQHPAVDFAVAPLLIFYSQPGDSPFLWNTFNEEDDLERFLRGDSPWNTASATWRRSSLAGAALRWNEQARLCQDWEFHIRALTSGLRFIKVATPDSYWRAGTSMGSIGATSGSQRAVLNRARLIKVVARHLQANGLLTAHRRRLLASQLFVLAFRSHQPPKRARLIWGTVRPAGLSTPLQWALVLCCEFVVRGDRRLGRGYEHRLFPNLTHPAQYGIHRFDPDHPSIQPAA